MDVTMPELDGLEATSLITRADPKSQIIELTQHDSETVRNKAKSAGRPRLRSEIRPQDTLPAIHSVQP